MAEQHRRVAAGSHDQAWALADNLSKRGFTIESQHPHEWVLRKPRRRGDEVVTIAISRAGGGPAPWAPPAGPPA